MTDSELRNKRDVQVKDASLFYLPVETRIPLKFGTETLSSVTCARACVTVVDKLGKVSAGWGETPLSVQWIWPSDLPYAERHETLLQFTRELTRAWRGFDAAGHPVEIGYRFQSDVLPRFLDAFNDRGICAEPVPYLAALVCCSPFDIALHDAYGVTHDVPVYETYTGEYMNDDLSRFLAPAEDAAVSFDGKYPGDFMRSFSSKLTAWHLVGGLDKLDPDEIDGSEPDDGYPVVLRDWIRRDGLRCLKVKLRGNDAEWDFRRLVAVGNIALDEHVESLTADFNCTVEEPAYVVEVMDRLQSEHPDIHKMILYVEQPFPYDLERFPIDVRAVSVRKPLFLDESAHDWRMIRLGRSLGWTGVALKTCKTQTGALLSASWARAHGMSLMVQDLTNPMLAQIPHVLLAAHVGTIKGVETNGMQFYPAASLPEAAIHPGLYTRHDGCVDLSTLSGPGFGYRLDEINRDLPPPAA